MRSVAEGFFGGMATPAKVVNILPVLHDLTMVIRDLDLSSDLERAIFHALDGNFHGILHCLRVRSFSPEPLGSRKTGASSFLPEAFPTFSTTLDPC